MKFHITSIVIFAVVACCGNLRADDLYTINGDSYINSTILEIQDERVRVSYRDGIGWISISDLTQDSLRWLKEQPAYKEHLIRLDLEKERTMRHSELARKRAEQEEQNRIRSAELAANRKIQEEKHKKAKADAIRDEIERLSQMEVLWVRDFNKLEDLFEGASPNPSSFLTNFIFAFGKPQHERVYKVPTTEWATTRSGIQKVRGLDANITELTYTNRLKNPLTGNKENLVLQFNHGFYMRAKASQSGRTSR